MRRSKSLKERSITVEKVRPWSLFANDPLTDLPDLRIDCDPIPSALFGPDWRPNSLEAARIRAGLPPRSS